jgi:3-oxoacyl-[acyl-carrier-protein] synthase-3
MGSRIVATGRALPRTAVTNQDLARFMDTSDEWIRSRTGIGQRYTLRSGESLVDIAAEASRIALSRAGLKPTEIDAIMVGTVSSEYSFPSFACQLQNALGADSSAAFDLAAACSGFVYALSMADATMRIGDFQRVLVIGTDSLSTFVDWSDRRTAVLFGDGAGAAVLVSEPGDRGVLGSVLRASGKHWELLSCRTSGVRSPLDSEVRRDREETIKMKGPELFKIAVKSMEEVSRQVAARAGVSIEDVNLVVGHQANRRIISAVAERLGLPEEKVFINIERYEQGRIHDRDLVMLNACGGGLTWGANLLRW